jgi:uncharacterized coiled-coil protein SlyX
MWTSKDRNSSGAGPRPGSGSVAVTRLLEALVLASLFALAPEWAASGSDSFLAPHPLWITVAILAARHGAGGLLAGVFAGVAAVGIGSGLAGADPRISWGRLDSAPNLIAFGACLAVSWIASWHLRREARLEERIRKLSERAVEADATIEALREAASTLRARVDRSSTSLSFLRDVASRLEGHDPVAAAEGAADLALARTGAHAAAVRVGIGGSQRLLAVRDARYAQAIASLDFRNADWSVPIRGGNERIGSLSLWGIPPTDRDEAMEHDLTVIASWCVRALALAPFRAGPEPPRALRAS